MNGFSACALILLSTNSRYTRGMATHAALMAAHPTRVRMVAAQKLLHFPWVSYMVTSTTVNFT